MVNATLQNVFSPSLANLKETDHRKEPGAPLRCSGEFWKHCCLTGGEVSKNGQRSLSSALKDRENLRKNGKKTSGAAGVTRATSKLTQMGSHGLGSSNKLKEVVMRLEVGLPAPSPRIEVEFYVSPCLSQNWNHVCPGYAKEGGALMDGILKRCQGLVAPYWMPLSSLDALCWSFFPQSEIALAICMRRGPLSGGLHLLQWPLTPHLIVTIFQQRQSDNWPQRTVAGAEEPLGSRGFLVM